MIEIEGFDWWAKLTPSKIQEDVEEVERKNKTKNLVHHPLEFTQFNHLLELITGSFQKWPEDKNFTVGEFINLLQDCESIEQLLNKLNMNTQKISLWEHVFSRYFIDKEKSIDLGIDLREKIIPLRNKVMHHRPIRLFELDIAKEVERKTKALLKTAKAKLSEGERENAKQISDFVDTIIFDDETLERFKEISMKIAQAWQPLIEFSSKLGRG